MQLSHPAPSASRTLRITRPTHQDAMPLRPATLPDASSIAAISLEVWLGTYLKHGVSAFFADYALETFTTAKTAQLIADPDQHILVSENAEGLDGFIRLTSGVTAPVAGCADLEVATLYVQPRHHGKGIGKTLLQAAVDHARASGRPSLWLTTNAENLPAIAFYRAQGFRLVGDTHFSIGTQAYLNHVLIRHLDQRPAAL
jgi:diamine N-acetyltransferase